MRARLLALTALLLFLSASVHGLNLYKLEIEVDLQEAQTQVTEKYFLTIPPEERQGFLNDYEEFGRSLMVWRNNYDFVYPRFGGIDDIEEITFYYDPQAQLLELSYTTSENIAVVAEDAPRTIKWSIPENSFESFITGSIINIPANVQLIFQLPSNATVNSEELSQEIVQQDHQLLLQDYRGSNLLIYYYTDKPIAPPLDLSSFISQLFTDRFMQIILTLLAFVLLAMIVYRRQLARRLEDYVVQHSELGGEKEEEELELE